MSEDGTAPDGNGASAQDVIAAFGGIRPMANKLGVAVSTVQGWKERGVIPEARHPEILEAAGRNNIDLDAALLATGSQAPDGHSETGRQPKGQGPEKGSAETAPAETAPTETAATETAATGDRAAALAAAPGADSGPRSGRPAPGGPTRPGSVPPSGTSKARPEMAEAQASRSGGGGLLAGMAIGAAVAALGFLAAVLTIDHWRPLLAGPDEGRSGEVDLVLDDLSARIAAQDRRLDALRADVASWPAGESGEILALAGGMNELEAAVEDLRRRLSEAEAGSGPNAELEARLARLESSTASQGATADALARALRDNESLALRLDGLSRELEELRRRGTDLEGDPGRQVLVLLGVVQLGRAIDLGRPYDAELSRLRRVTDGDTEFAAPLDRLAADSDSGVATLTELRASFAPVAGSIVASGTADQAGGWASGVLRRLLDVITIRPVGQVEGDGVGAIVARSEQRLAEGDVAAAVAELEALDGSAAAAAAEWLDAARRRIGAQEALAAIVARLADRLAPAEG